MSYRVTLARQTDYRVKDLERLFDGIFKEFGVYEKLHPGMTVVLKPNLILRSDPKAAMITHPVFVQAAGRCVKKTGAQVLIAESPGGPYTPAVMRSHFKACGYTDMAAAEGFALYTDCKSREAALPDGQRCRQAAIVEPFLDADFIIDLPKVKTHSMVGYSGAVKNMFGTVPGLQKPELHCRFPDREDFSQMLVDICQFTLPGFVLMDGIWAMEGDGPTSGTRRDLGLVAASDNPFAADVVVSSLLGMKPMELEVLRNGAERHLGPIEPGEIMILGENYEKFFTPDFKKARASSTDFVDKLPKFMRPLAKKITTPYPRIDRKKCIGCGKCAESCPQHTITVKDRKAEIEYKQCIRCFCCHEMCPEHIIGVKRFGAFKF